MLTTRLPGVLAVVVFFATMVTACSAYGASTPSGYRELVDLFEAWRSFERPVMNGAVPDYSATAMAAKAKALPQWRKRLDAIDTKGWPIEQQNDYKLVKAEMNGFDFNLRVLRPWARDPAFYVSVWAARSDCPLREGPLAYPAIELYNFKFPTGASGVGKENYNWYQRNVHFVPFTWDEQVVLLHRELERAQAALRLEELKNRNLPPLDPVTNAAAFEKLTHASLDTFDTFLVTQQIIPDKPYIKPALQQQLGHFVPEDQRIFFTRVTHREPMLLLSHDYHWIDLARMRDEPNPSPIRRLASLSNIWDNRAEGFATAFEEIVMHAGLYDDNPRAKELVWIMLANRAARGLASLYVQANEMNLEQAGQFHAKWTPRGWAVANDQLTAFEQLLYLRQPGYGTSYIIGKILFDRLLNEYAEQQDLAGKPFVLRDFMDRFNNEGMIPIPLMEAEMISKQAREP